MTASPDSKTVYLVAGDIGGTNSRLGLYSSQTKDDHGLPSQLVYKEYKNEEHLTAAPDGDSNVDKETAFERRILAPFLKHCWETKSDEATSEKLQSIHESELVVCLAVCGPVRDNQVMLNKQKELQINGDDILQRNSRKRKQAAGNDDTSTFNPYLAAIVDCQIINDFVAQGYGCLSLDHDKDVTELTPASKDLKRKNPSGTMVCLGAGTGLGCCFLTCSNGTYTCHPSEFGQTEWAVTFDSEELQLFNETEGVTLETVVSGKGFSFCYDIYADSIFNDGQVNQDVRNEYLKKKSLTDEMKVKLVVENVDNHCRACHKAMETVMSHYGRAAADCALTFLPFGGLYVTGGVALKNRKYMETPKATAGGHSSNHSYFFNGYWHNHKMDSLLKTIPLFLVEREDMGMRGAIKYAEIIFEATQYAAKS